jgi:hypothetical protein
MDNTMLNEINLRGSIGTLFCELFPSVAMILLEEVKTCEDYTLPPLYETLVRMQEERTRLPEQQLQLVRHLVMIKRVEIVPSQSPDVEDNE